MRSGNFILILLFVSLQVFGQTSVQLILKTDRPIDKVDVFDISQEEIYSSAYNDTLLFHFKKTNIDCYNIRYHEDGKMYRQQIWLNSGDIIIKSHIDNDGLIIDTVINSPIYYKSQDFSKSYSSILKTNDTTKINAFLLKQFEQNLKNPFSYAIGQNYLFLNQNSKLNLSNLKPLLKKQGDDFKWFLLYPLVVDRLNSILTADKVKLADFSFIDSGKKEVKLDLSTADYFILDFWFLGCAPCIREHKEIKPMLNKLKDKKIEVIGITIDNIENFKSWQSYLIKNEYTWKNYMQGNGSSLTESLSIHSFPTYVIIDRTGEIVGSYNMFSDIIKRFMVDE